MKMKRFMIPFLLLLLLTSCMAEVEPPANSESELIPVQKMKTVIEVSVDGKIMGEEISQVDAKMFFSKDHLSEMIAVTVKNIGEYEAELHVNDNVCIGSSEIQGTITDALQPGEQITFSYVLKVNPDDGIPSGTPVSTLTVSGNFDARFIHIRGEKTDVPMLGISYDDMLGNGEHILIGSSSEHKDTIEIKGYKARKDNVITLSCRFLENGDVCSLIDDVEILDESKISSEGKTFEFLGKTGASISIRFTPPVEGMYLAGIGLIVNTSDGKTHRLNLRLSIEVVEIDERFMAYDEAFLDLGKRGQILSITKGSNGHSYLYEMHEGKDRPDFILMELDAQDEFIGMWDGTTNISPNHVYCSWIDETCDYFYLLGRTNNGYILIEKYDLLNKYLDREIISIEISNNDIYLGSTDDNLFFADKNEITSYDKKANTWSHVSLVNHEITSFTYDEVNDIHCFVDGDKNEILYGKLSELNDLLDFRRIRIRDHFEGNIRKYISTADQQYILNDRNELYCYFVEQESWEKVLTVDGNTEYIDVCNGKLYFYDRTNRMIKNYAAGAEFPVTELRRNFDPYRYGFAVIDSRLYLFSTLTDFNDSRGLHTKGYIRRIPLI